MECWSEENLAEALLAGGPTDELSLHAGECLECGDRLDEWTLLLDDLHALRGPEPPPGTVRRAQALVPRFAGLRHAVEAIRASLLLDSMIQMAPARSAGAAREGTVRSLRYEQGGRVLDVLLARKDSGEIDLTGGLMDAGEEAPFVAWLLPAVPPSTAVLSDDDGHFSFHNLPEGTYELRLELENADLLAGPISVD